MKKVRKILGLVLSLSLVVGLFVGCGSSSSGSSQSSSTKKKHKFGYTCMTMNNPFFQVLEKSIRAEVEKNGDQLITMDPAMDVSKQIDQINDMITQGVDAVFLNPVDWEGVRPGLEALKKANIPIINFDTEVKDMNYVTAYVGSDNKNAGKVCGDDLVKRYPNGGKIAILNCPTMNSINDRIAGFKSAIEGKNFTIVAEQDGKGDLQTSMKLADDILQSHSDIVAIMGGNDPTALGALAACKSAKQSKILVYGVDGSPDAKKEIASGGQFVGTGAQSPKQIGVKAAELGYKVLNKQNVEKKTPVQTFLINKDNVAKYGTTGWQ